MPILVAQISPSQKQQILHARESHFLDLKSIDIRPAKLSRTISAFANASGGEMYIGIEEINDGINKIRFWRGFSDVEAANAHIQVFEELFPLGQYYSYTFLSDATSVGLVLHITVNKTRDITRASDGTAYIRRGAQNLPVATDEGLARLKLDKGVVSFERELLDVDPQIISTSPILIEFLNYVIPTADPEPWLLKQLLLQRDMPTVAGVLLFAEEPQAILPKRCGIKIYRYRTSDSEGNRDTLVFDPITIEGSLYYQIKVAVAKTIEIIEEIPKMGIEGLVSIKYPEETIHEILTNAVLHRDYSIPADVHVRIFDNRIEIESPGKLPGHVTRSNILREQFARNGTIVRLINKFPDPPNKDVGEGLNTAFLAMSRLRLQPPIIDETETSVIVYIKHEHLASIEATVMEYLETYPNITNRTARNLTGIRSEGTVKDAFYRLRDKGLIELVPGRPRAAAAWRRMMERTGPEPVTPSTVDLIEKGEAVILEYLETHTEITNRLARQITGIQSEGGMKWIFYRLRSRGSIELVPGRSRVRAAWRKTSDGQ